METENVKTPASTEVVQHKKSPISFGNQGVQLASLEEAFRFANAICASGFAPKGMEKPEAVLVAIQLGAELGLTPMAALQNTAVINGRPAIYGDAALALVRSSGLLESYKEEEIGEVGSDAYGYRVTAARKGDQAAIESFTVADAKRAKLWGKAGPWTQYPEQMLRARARAFALRMADNAPLSIAGSKKVLDGLTSGPGTLDLEEIAATIVHAMTSRDYAEGRQAFTEKRRQIGRAHV